MLDIKKCFFVFFFKQTHGAIHNVRSIAVGRETDGALLLPGGGAPQPSDDLQELGDHPMVGVAPSYLIPKALPHI